jgi:hypothetical protein
MLGLHNVQYVLKGEKAGTGFTQQMVCWTVSKNYTFTVSVHGNTTFFFFFFQIITNKI